VNIDRSIIASNNALGAGGAIENLGTLTLRDSIVRDNGAGFEGGGIKNFQTAALIRSTIISNNSQLIGGIYNDNSRTGKAFIAIDNSTISDNGSQFAGGILNSGIMVITNTTIAKNKALMISGGSGGIVNHGDLKIINSTISANEGLVVGAGGLTNEQTGSVKLQNTIIALNLAIPHVINQPPFDSDCSGTITSLGNNIIGDLTGCDINLLPTDLTGDPGLGDFTDNGKPGNGHFPLLATSQAIDAGNDAVCPRKDQLGQRRVGPCDIGAIRFLDGADRKREENDHQHEEDLGAAVQ
jgi:hypothetical protein